VFFFCLDTKETKNIHGLLLFFGIHEFPISSLQYFYIKNYRTNFPIATPAARVSHSTQGLFPVANVKIITVILDPKI
jgi:hypothetical protein